MIKNVKIVKVLFFTIFVTISSMQGTRIKENIHNNRFVVLNNSQNYNHGKIMEFRKES